MTTDDDVVILKLDEDLENADWAKTTWDLPIYKSAEFMSMFPDLDEFRSSGLYKHAVAQKLIVNDEWDPHMELTLRIMRAVRDAEQQEE